FIFNERINQDLILVAGGTGIAPFRSYIKYIIDKKLSNKVILFYSSKTPEDIIYYNEFKRLEKNHQNLKCVFTVTRHESSSWEGFTGRIDENMLKKYVMNLSDKIFYSCGPASLVNDFVAILKSNNVKDEQIKTEKWG
ncbi:MAG: xylene monooxygenase, partial [Nanoarchaeota archaeon]